MIKIENVNFAYANANSGALHDISLEVQPGECVLLCGASGCGKTTVTRLLNGLIPHYYEGELSGSVLVNGLQVPKAELYETARIVGSVFQNPRSQFFCVDTTSELAFGCENMGMPVETIQARINETTKSLKLSTLLGRSIFHLSGGEKQKIACGSVSAMEPEVFVLDEPTSNLDINAIEELKNTMLYWKARGKTIVIAEHRLAWLSGVCDRAVYLRNGRIEWELPMQKLLSFSAEQAATLGLRTLSQKTRTVPLLQSSNSQENLVLKEYCFSYNNIEVLRIPYLEIPIGSVVAVIGHNGAGKSTFSKCLAGLAAKFRGVAEFDGVAYRRKQMLKASYMVMQDVNHQLFCETVEEEVRLGMSAENAENTSAVCEQLGLGELLQRHPMSLSGGQKQRVAIASALLAEKEILIFDEPTSGLDFYNMEQTAALLRSLQGQKTVFIITHDIELVLRCCNYVLRLEQGRIKEQYPLSAEHVDNLLGFFGT